MTRRRQALALLLGLHFAMPAVAQEDIPTLEPELKPAPSEPQDSDRIEEPTPVPPVTEPEPEGEPLPESPVEPEEPAYDAPPPGGFDPGNGKGEFELAPPPKKKRAKKKKKKPARKHEVVIFGAALKYGFTSLAGSASEDDNSPTFGASLYMFQAPDPKKKLLGGLTFALQLDYENTAMEVSEDLAKRFEGESATLTMTGANVLVCALSNYPAKVCPFLGYATYDLSGEALALSTSTMTYGLNLVSGSPRIFKSMGLLAGGQLTLAYPLFADDQAETDWSASVGSVSLYLGVSY